MSYFDFYTEELTAGQRQELNGLMAIHEKAGARPYDAAMQAVRDKLSQAHENKAEVKKAIFESANPLKKYVDGAAHKSASSPKNNLPIPTAAQREAGNHTMGHLTLHGLSITIEIPKGGERSGIAPDGTPWSVEMLSHYGYLKRAIGADGENFDCYIGDDPSSQRVWIVDQVNAETGAFDEHKALIGYEDQEDATRAYLGAFSDGKGKARIGAITEISLESFKAWLKTDKTQKPMSAVLESGVDYRSAIEAATSFEDIQAVFARVFTVSSTIYPETEGLIPKQIKAWLNKIKKAKDRDKKTSIYYEFLNDGGDENKLLQEMVLSLPAGSYKLHSREYGTNIMDEIFNIYGTMPSYLIKEPLLLGLTAVKPEKIHATFTHDMDKIEIYK